LARDHCPRIPPADFLYPSSDIKPSLHTQNQRGKLRTSLYSEFSHAKGSICLGLPDRELKLVR